MASSNAAFYEQMKLESFMEFARLTGFTNGIDIDILYPYIKDASTLVELGAGYGRAIDFLLKKGFKGQLIAVDRIQHLVDGLEQRFGDKAGPYLCQDILELDLPEPVDAIAWLWSGILELTVPEQIEAISRLHGQLKKGGLLALESPYKQIKVVGEHADSRHIRLQTEWGELNAFLPTDKEIEFYAKKAGFSSFDMVFYTSDTGLERVFYMLRK